MHLVIILVGLVAMMTLYVRGCLNFSSVNPLVSYIPQTKGETVDDHEIVSWAMVGSGLICIVGAIYIWRRNG